LRDAQRELVTLEVLAARSIRDNSVEEELNVELRQRLASLQADRQTYLDLRRLHSIGADLALEVASKHCPTCDQSIEDVLLPQGALTAPMALEENLRFISGQITTFQTMLQDSERVLENRSRSVTAISSKLQELRTTIRSYRDALISSQNSASAGAVRERLVVEGRLQTIQTLKNMMNETVAELTLFSEQYGDLQRALEALKEDRSVEDEAKLSALQASFLSQLDQYGFSSITPTSALQISRETFRPTYEAFDLGFNLSASDMIRTIWSYLNGLMEVARTQDTNHLGLLVLDEPRQQQANKFSFSAFALRAWHCSSPPLAGGPISPTSPDEVAILTDRLHQRFRSAVRWLRKAAQQGHGEAQLLLGVFLSSGDVFSFLFDPEEAAEWFRRAADQGLSGAQLALARQYQMGSGVPRDELEAMRWFTKAAEQGDEDAQLALGMMYYAGNGVDQDQKTAAIWIRKAAEKGLASAQANLGIMYQNGYGVRTNYRNASAWFLKAAEQGHASSQREIGLYYLNGRGVDQDFSSAAHWLNQAAEQGGR
jgi:TPR repeat protein